MPRRPGEKDARSADLTGLAAPTGGDIPEGTVGFGLGCFWRQADIPQEMVVQPCKAAALSPKGNEDAQAGHQCQRAAAGGDAETDEDGAGHGEAFHAKR